VSVYHYRFGYGIEEIAEVEFGAVGEDGGVAAGGYGVSAGDVRQSDVAVDDAHAAVNLTGAAVAVKKEALGSDDAVFIGRDRRDLKADRKIKIHLGVIGRPGVVARHKGLVVLRAVFLPFRLCHDPGAGPREDGEMTDLCVLVEGAADAGVLRVVGGRKAHVSRCDAVEKILARLSCCGHCGASGSRCDGGEGKRGEILPYIFAVGDILRTEDDDRVLLAARILQDALCNIDHLVEAVVAGTGLELDDDGRVRILSHPEHKIVEAVDALVRMSGTSESRKSVKGSELGHERRLDVEHTARIEAVHHHCDAVARELDVDLGTVEAGLTGRDNARDGVLGVLSVVLEALVSHKVPSAEEGVLREAGESVVKRCGSIGNDAVYAKYG